MAKSNGKRSEGQYAPMPYGVLKSPAWRSLSGAAVKVFFELHARFNGGNNGRIHLSMNEAASALGLGKATVQRAFQELQHKGFIALETEGNWYHRRAHEWRLTMKPMHGVRGKEGATNEWHFWRPEKTERGSDTDPSASPVVRSQNPKRLNGSKLEPVSAISGSSLGSGMEH